MFNPADGFNFPRDDGVGGYQDVGVVAFNPGFR